MRCLYGCDLKIIGMYSTLHTFYSFFVLAPYMISLCVYNWSSLWIKMKFLKRNKNDVWVKKHPFWRDIVDWSWRTGKWILHFKLIFHFQKVSLLMQSTYFRKQTIQFKSVSIYQHNGEITLFQMHSKPILFKGEPFVNDIDTLYVSKIPKLIFFTKTMYRHHWN